MTQQIIIFLVVMGATIALFVADRLRVDVVALLVMVSLPWLGLVSPAEAVSGFASNAVISIIAIMILGHGIDRTGVMSRLARPVTELAQGSQRRLLALVSGSVGMISAFMQNIGAAALFLPAVLRISRRLERPASRLLMPMGFAAILGGTLTMVASGPLILLNDLLAQQGEQPYGLFDVTPLGLALLGGGIVYFLLLGGVVLPQRPGRSDAQDPQRALAETWGLARAVHCLRVPDDSPLIGLSLEQTKAWSEFEVHVLVLGDGDQRQYAPWRQTRLSAGQQLAVLGELAAVERFAAQGLELCETRQPLLDELETGEVGGFAELVIRPGSELAGHSLRELALRKRFGVEPVVLLSGDQPAQHEFSDQPLRAGDILVVHGLWERVRSLADDASLACLTPLPAGQSARGKALPALGCFVVAIGLAIAGFPLSISLLSGALAMILLRVTTIDDAYRAVDWRTVFLLAGLIPLGIAMERSGTAGWLAATLTELLVDAPVLLLLVAVAALATFLSLFMSNVAATVLLVPLVAELGAVAEVSPRALGLLVAVCASNSFLLPTHQVNALLMAPGGYRNRDYLRAGSGMTLLFVVVAVGLIFLGYLG